MNKRKKAVQICISLGMKNLKKSSICIALNKNDLFPPGVALFPYFCN